MNKIALLPIKGMITSERSPLGGMGMTSSMEIAQLLGEIRRKKGIKALILEINSPGGSPYACKEIAEMLKSIGKPVVAWLKEVAASGAYWIASAADVIIADSMSTIGSVGVTSIRPDFSKLLNKLGIDMDVVASGAHKTYSLPFKALTPEEKHEDRQLRQEEIEIIQRSFLNEVKENRRLMDEAVGQISSGKIYLGEQAKNLGLVDELGGREEAFGIAAKKAGITRYGTIDYTKKLEKHKRKLLARLLDFF
jgi:protease-4